MDHHINKRSSKHYEKLPWTLIPMHPVVDDTVAAPIDPCIPQRPFTESDFEGHRAHTVYVGVHVPARRSHRRRKHIAQKSGEAGEKGSQDSQERPVTPPAQRVQFILGEDANGEDGICVPPPLESHPLFSEMEELVKDGDEIEWKETARWVKFEEDVEEGGNRWSKPHVATLSLHSLFELRNLILTGTVMLDMEASSLEQVADLVTENMMNTGLLPFESKVKVKEALLRRHRHQHEKEMKKGGPSTVNMSRLPIIRSLADIGKNHSTAKSDNTPLGVTTTTFVLHAGASTSPSQDNQPAKGVEEQHQQNSNNSPTGLKNGNNGSGAKFLSVPGKNSFDQAPQIISPSSTSQMLRNVSSCDFQGLDHHRINFNFMRKIPRDAEASNILVGEVDFLPKTLSAFIRLNQAVVMGDLTEVPVPTRFIFVLLGPSGSQTTFHEIGRSMATLMSDEVFHEVAYRARKRDHLIAGIDEFLDAVTVLPPGEWDPSIRIEPPAAIPSQEVRKRAPEKQPKKEEPDEEEEEQRIREDSGLTRSGRLFGGLVNDIKRKKPWYISDFKDGFNLQSVASWIFLYFACLSPIVTFGGLLAEATGKNMAAMESLVSGFVCGIVYGFFSGQPLTILGSTGPVLVFETIVFEFCDVVDWDYMTFRFWIGTWVAIILLILVAIDASAFVCYITRFTEENFATLIAFIFIYKAIENTFAIANKLPLGSCLCELPATGLNNSNHGTSMPQFAPYNETMCGELKGKLVGDCMSTPYASPIFLMSFMLFAGTFIISTVLKDFKNSLFFPANVRQFITDFAVIIAISLMTFIDYITNIPTPKLDVPSEFKPTLEDRGWIVSPYHEKNPFWSCIIAIIPALLGTILIFMDQQITAVIINRKENKLKKGCGYHLDLFILAILIQICTILGCPWFVAATVLSINHVNSLKLESETAAPGEKPQFLGVREQRVTHIMIFLTIGCSVKLTPLLSHIPMPVLFGVFLYMGAASLKGLQFYDRLIITLMPAKYQPDFMFLRQVPIKRVHLFTLIQLGCLVMLWVIKSFQATSILFPLMLVVMIGVRKSLDCIFTRRELKILDDIMPEMGKRPDDDLHHLEDGGSGAEQKNLKIQQQQKPTVQLTFSNGSLTNVNISEELNKTSIWKQLTESGDGNPKLRSQSSIESKKDSPTYGEKRLSIMQEEDEINSDEKRITSQNIISQV